jgi:FtsP/CotA-like multicopper oxidase with cupredoxin domain
MNNNLIKVNAAALLLMLGAPGLANAAANVQCLGDTNGDAVVDKAKVKGVPTDNIKCMHLGAGDGFVTMADGKLQYIFSFVDLTGIPQEDALDAGILAANFPAPTITLDEGQEFYLTLTNYGMLMRPDLADPHTVHFHGFPNASSVFDGVPEASISINMAASLTYYYNIVEPGTYMYHCHMEATEHMQMGMLGNLYVRPAQNGTVIADPDGSGRSYDTFVYNDTDGGTGYDVEYPIQLAETFDFRETPDSGANSVKAAAYPDAESPLTTSQPVSARIEATAGQKVLLRLSNLNVTRYYTLTALGLPPMKVVGTGARILRGRGEAGGLDTSYDTSAVTLGGGESLDVIIDTQGVAPGTYFLYTTNLNYLSNNDEDFGGMMTEIHIN